eukprot:NODE_5947_length_947_cov_84.220874_g5360_i0.p1 GENE.NODE_5947_length_947_cov_84.220874_g5360_i0~~NODE_5947_length_947_cov_84.220874_g5360_i0.p1  ORF type:complete len:223 (-),score=50.17 NODE_5947_length_947_cov_84.220874_g5360_i0:13-681(-)
MAFGRLGKSTNRKSNLRKFSGVNGETEDMVKQRVSRLKPFKLLKEVVQLFDCKSSGSTMEDYSNALVKFLLKPEPSGNLKTSSKEKGKTKTRSKKAKKVSTGPKKPLTAFFHFLKEARELVKKKHPEYSITEVTQKCSSKWRKMTDDEKKPFEKLARKDKERYEAEKKGEKQSKRAPSTSSSSSSGSDSDSSSDSEEEKKASKGKSKRKEKAKKAKKDEKTK